MCSGCEKIPIDLLDKIKVYHYKPSARVETVYLNSDKSSWIQMVRRAAWIGLKECEFDQLWALRPKNRQIIKMYGKEVTCPRYSQVYFRPYWFSGMLHQAAPDAPTPIVKLLERCAEINDDLNQSLVNWYEADGSIGKHSDDTRQLMPNSEIWSWSFGPAKRTFIVEPRKPQEGEEAVQYHIEITDNTLVVMGGACQRTHLHSVPKEQDNGEDQRRLNITFRCFKSE